MRIDASAFRAGVLGFAIGVGSTGSAAFAQDCFTYIKDGGIVEGAGGHAETTAWLMGNYFTAEPGHERIIGIAFGNSPLPKPYTVTALLYEDPTDDGHPGDAVLVAQTPIGAGDGGSLGSPIVFDEASFPGVNVQGGFFAAVLVELEAPTFPHMDFSVDHGGDKGQACWVASENIDITDLTGSMIHQPTTPQPFIAFVRVLAGPACLGDFDSSGELNILDFVAFQSAFAAGDACADANGDGGHNILDFVAFQSAFAAGCGQ